MTFLLLFVCARSHLCLLFNIFPVDFMCVMPTVCVFVQVYEDECDICKCTMCKRKSDFCSDIEDIS